MAGVTPRVGDKMAAALPVAPELVERVAVEDHLLVEAMGKFVDLCSPHGLTPVEVKQDWVLTAKEMRRRGMAVTDDMPDDVIMFGFSARAAATPAGVAVVSLQPAEETT